MPQTHNQQRTAQIRDPGRRSRGPQDLTAHLSLGAPPFAAYRIGETTSCLRNARGFTSDVLRRWGLEAVREDAVQVASELVANAVRHGCRTPPPGASDPVVWLALTRRPHTLLCVVYDPSDQRPRLMPPAPLAEHHRGLPIVNALSDDWGWKPTGASGKAVWARLSLPT